MAIKALKNKRTHSPSLTFCTKDFSMKFYAWLNKRTFMNEPNTKLLQQSTPIFLIIYFQAKQASLIFYLLHCFSLQAKLNNKLAYSRGGKFFSFFWKCALVLKLMFNKLVPVKKTSVLWKKFGSEKRVLWKNNRGLICSWNPIVFLPNQKRSIITKKVSYRHRYGDLTHNQPLVCDFQHAATFLLKQFFSGSGLRFSV